MFVLGAPHLLRDMGFFIDYGHFTYQLHPKVYIFQMAYMKQFIGVAICKQEDRQKQSR